MFTRHDTLSAYDDEMESLDAGPPPDDFEQDDGEHTVYSYQTHDATAEHTSLERSMHSSTAHSSPNVAAEDSLPPRAAESYSYPPIPNLDAFLTSVYTYFINGGFMPTLVTRLTHLTALAFTIIISVVICTAINWEDVWECKSDCDQVQILKKPQLDQPTSLTITVIVYTVIFCLYWLWHVLATINAVRDALEMRAFYNNQLHISDSVLPSMSWDAVVDKLVTLQSTVKICKVKDLNALDITNRIMRLDNYVIALFNQDCIDLTLPSLSCWPSWSWQRIADNDNNNNNNNTETSSVKTTTARLHNSWYVWLFYGTLLDYNIRLIVTHSLFDSNFNISRQSVGEEGARAIRVKLYLMALINIILMPFIFLFVLIHFILSHTEELHSRRAQLALRQWTLLSQWRLREYNELPHFFQRRLNEAATVAQLYLQQFPSPTTHVIAQCIAYMSGAIVAVLILLTLTGTDMLNAHLFERSLLWYLAVFSGVLAISRAFMDDMKANYQPALVMSQLIQHTHYCPQHWYQQTHTDTVRREFSYMYRTRIALLIGEMCSVLFTPFILAFILPRSSERIVSLIERSSTNLNGVGTICSFAVFAMESDSRNERKSDADEAPTVNTKDVLIHVGGSERQPPRSRHGKMGKSLVSFAMNHPHWNVNDDDKDYNNAAERTVKPPSRRNRFLSELLQSTVLPANATDATAVTTQTEARSRTRHRRRAHRDRSPDSGSSFSSFHQSDDENEPTAEETTRRTRRDDEHKDDRRRRRQSHQLTRQISSDDEYGDDDDNVARPLTASDAHLLTSFNDLLAGDGSRIQTTPLAHSLLYNSRYANNTNSRVLSESQSRITQSFRGHHAMSSAALRDELVAASCDEMKRTLFGVLESRAEAEDEIEEGADDNEIETK